MIKKQNKQILVKGPPGLIVRKSRDSLRMFGVRGDPELNEPGNLTGFENLSGLNPTAAPSLRATAGSVAICRKTGYYNNVYSSMQMDCFGLLSRPRNDGQTIISSLRATEESVATVAPSLRATAGSVAICRKTGYYNNVYSSMQMDCFGLLRRLRNDGQTLVASSLRATEGSVLTVLPSLRATAGSVAICQLMNGRILNRVQENKKKDCVRVELDSGMFPENWSKLGFHHAPGMMKRNLTGFQNLSGLIPSSLRATAGSVAICQILEQVQDDKYDEDDMKQILNRVQENKKKNCVRVELDSRVFPENWSKLVFHRAPGILERNLTGFQYLSGLIPTIDWFDYLLRPRNDGQTTKSSLRATEGSVVTVAPSLRATTGSMAICQMGTYNNKV